MPSLELVYSRLRRVLGMLPKLAEVVASRTNISMGTGNTCWQPSRPSSEPFHAQPCLDRGLWQVPRLAGFVPQSVGRAGTQAAGLGAGRCRGWFRPAWIGAGYPESTSGTVSTRYNPVVSANLFDASWWTLYIWTTCMPPSYPGFTCMLLPLKCDQLPQWHIRCQLLVLQP